MELIVGWSTVLALLGHFSFLLFVVVNLFRKVTGRALLLASTISLVWIATRFHPLTAPLQIPTEFLLVFAWQGLILRALGFRFRERRTSQVMLRQVFVVSIVSGVGGILFYFASLFASTQFPRFFVPLCFIVLNVTGLVLIEQLARNVLNENVWRIRYLTLGLGVIFGFGVLVWSLRLAIGGPAELLGVLQPLIYSLALVPIAIASLRNRSNRLRFNLSRQFVFRTGVLAAAGLFLVSLSLLTYIAQIVGGDIGLTLAIFLGIVAIIGFFAVVGSTRFRNTAKVLLTKTLFESRYDYRDEWTKLTERFSNQDVDYTLVDHVQISLAELLHAKSSSLWLKDESRLKLERTFGDRIWPKTLSEECTQGLLNYYSKRDWVLCLSDVGNEDDVPVAQIREELPEAEYVVPLFLSDSLYAICFVNASEVKRRELDWEDFDILKLTARQGASFLALASANKALVEHEKFAAVAQMSAFLTHDIKTINAQLMLLLENAVKHKDNPAFIDDMLKTIENSTQRMSKITSGLSRPNVEMATNDEITELAPQLSHWHAIELTHEPRITIACPDQLRVPQEYLTAINHIARNALEASSGATLTITVEADVQFVYIHLKDTGPGMSEDFIKDKLFEPFHSSKGVTGMGIGAFQAKSIVEKYGGRLLVSSILGQGTEFTIEYPLASL